MNSLNSLRSENSGVNQIFSRGRGHSNTPSMSAYNDMFVTESSMSYDPIYYPSGTELFSDVQDIDTFVESKAIWDNLDDVKAQIVSLPTRIAFILPTVELYCRPLVTFDLRFGIITEVHVCDFCFRDLDESEEVYSSRGLISCLSLLPGVDICISCFKRRTIGCQLECFSCEVCGVKSIVDISEDLYLNLRKRFCSDCRKNKPLCFYVSIDESLFWQERERVTDLNWWVIRVNVLDDRMLDELVESYNHVQFLTDDEMSLSSTGSFCKITL